VFARVATFEGADTSRIDEMIEGVRGEIESESAPEGLEGVTRVEMLVYRESGKTMGITIFESEDALRRGDAALNEMSPGEGGGRRVGVDMYEVALVHDFVNR
jgi:hypothetical protein